MLTTHRYFMHLGESEDEQTLRAAAERCVSNSRSAVDAAFRHCFEAQSITRASMLLIHAAYRSIAIVNRNNSDHPAILAAARADGGVRLLNPKRHPDRGDRFCLCLNERDARERDSLSELDVVRCVLAKLLDKILEARSAKPVGRGDE